jgi:hypothetical protein
VLAVRIGQEVGLAEGFRQSSFRSLESQSFLFPLIFVNRPLPGSTGLFLCLLPGTPPPPGSSSDLD